MCLPSPIMSVLADSVKFPTITRLGLVFFRFVPAYLHVCNRNAPLHGHFRSGS